MWTPPLLVFFLLATLVLTTDVDHNTPTSNQEEEGLKTTSLDRDVLMTLLEGNDCNIPCESTLLWVKRCLLRTIDLNMVPVRLKQLIDTEENFFMQLTMEWILAMDSSFSTNIDECINTFNKDKSNIVDGDNDDHNTTNGSKIDSMNTVPETVTINIFQLICFSQTLDTNRHFQRYKHLLNRLSRLKTTPRNITLEHQYSNKSKLLHYENYLFKFSVKFKSSRSPQPNFLTDSPNNRTPYNIFFMLNVSNIEEKDKLNDTELQESVIYKNLLFLIGRSILITSRSAQLSDEEDFKKYLNGTLVSDSMSKLSLLLYNLQNLFTENVTNLFDKNCSLHGSYECTLKIHISENDTLDVSEYVRTSDALEIINVVGHSLSLFSIMCITATAVAFKHWRRALSNKILLNMSAAILLNIPLFFIINYTTVDSDVTTCIIFGVVLHYSCLSCFCWMLVMSGLQLLRLVTVFGAKRNSHLLLKVAAFAWGAPLIPIIVLLAWDTGFYSADMEQWGFCFPRGKALMLTVRAPLYIILTINVVVFAVILCRIYMCCGWGKMDDDMRRHGDGYRYNLNRTRTTVALFFLLGLPWTIGYLLYDPISSAYLFSITTSNQGVMLFVFFVVLDKKTRGYWKEAFRKLKSRNRRKSSLTPSKCKPIEAV